MPIFRVIAFREQEARFDVEAENPAAAKEIIALLLQRGNVQDDVWEPAELYSEILVVGHDEES